MGGFTLEIQCPKNVGGMAADPQPDWSFDDLLLELNLLENRLLGSLKTSLSFTKNDAREIPNSNDKNRASGGFFMQVLDKELDTENDGYIHDQVMVRGRRFACGELTLSDSEDSEDESAIELQSNLMPHVGFVEGVLSELTHDRRFAVMEEIRSQIIDLETGLTNENEKFASMLARTEKYTETKRELDRKFDMQYQRRIAEALDNHLTAVQRDHEHKSQIEERRIRDDAIREEAKRKERVLYEEKVRQEKIEAEAKARLEAERAEAAKAAALEAERRAAEAAAQKKASLHAKNAAPGVSENASETTSASQGSLISATKSAQSTGDLIRSAENALKLEERRLQTYEEVAATNHALKTGSQRDYSEHERKIKRNIRLIRGSQESVRARATELLHLINDPSYPQSISIMMFVDMIVAQCCIPAENRTLYALARVIVLVTSKVPLAMDMLIAKLNRVCIYTVPKHISHSKSAFETKEAYYKAIGFVQENNERIETPDSFVARLSSYMKLYGALVQTEIKGIRNLHGLEEGWAWLARFLNALPPNSYTAVALHAFLEMAGYALYKRYKNQFKKIVAIINRDFLDALREDLKTTPAVHNFRYYLKSNQFLKEPEERELKSDIMSHHFVA